MTFLEVKELCRKGKTGLIPGWKGYLNWNYALDEMLFIDGDYRMNQNELELKIVDRDDLYYII